MADRYPPAASDALNPPPASAQIALPSEAGQRTTGCYVSPFRAIWAERYSSQVADYVLTRAHRFPRPDGSFIDCKPTHCRECWREQNWHDHGPANHCQPGRAAA